MSHSDREVCISTSASRRSSATISSGRETGMASRATAYRGFTGMASGENPIFPIALRNGHRYVRPSERLNIGDPSTTIPLRVLLITSLTEPITATRLSPTSRVSITRMGAAG